MSALAVLLRVVLLALVPTLPLGLAAGHFLAHTRSRLKPLLDGAVVLPLVLPPSVVGFGLLLLLGRRGPVGALLERAFGLRLVFTVAGAALAAAVVAFPLMAKGAQAAFALVDPRLEAMGAVHGLSRWRIFRTITLPLALPGLTIAATLAALRALGEFGATLTFAGYLPGVTSTAPLEVYMAFQAGDDRTALRLVLALSAVCLITAAGMVALERRVSR